VLRETVAPRPLARAPGGAVRAETEACPPRRSGADVARTARGNKAPSDSRPFNRWDGNRVLLPDVFEYGPLSHLPTRSFRPHSGRVLRRVRIGRRGDAGGSHPIGTISRGRSLEKQPLHRPSEPRCPALGPAATRVDGVLLAARLCCCSTRRRLQRSAVDQHDPPHRPAAGALDAGEHPSLRPVAAAQQVPPHLGQDVDCLVE